MRMLAVSARLIFAALACMLAPGAMAQNAQNAPAGGPELIPRDLAEALLRPYIGFSFNGGGAFVVGKVPPSLAPYLYIPANAHVIGGIETPTTTIAVFTVPMPWEQVRIVYGREEPKLGWTQPPTYDAMRGWGFMPAPGTGPSGDGYEYCHIGQSLRISPSYSTAEVTQVTATVQNFGGSRCGLQQQNVGGRPTPPPGAPTVFNPDGSQMNAQTCLQFAGLGSISSTTSERLQTSLSPGQLLDYFARQLADSGWKGATTEPGARRTWTRPDTGGLTRELTMTALPATNATKSTDCRDLTMTVRLVPPLLRRP
jgi:hypothetical protein